MELPDILSQETSETEIIPTLTIDVGTTWFAVPSDIQGNLPVGINIANFIYSVLTQWEYNPKLGIRQLMYNYSAYDKIQKKAILPRYALPGFLSFLGEAIEVEYHHVPAVQPREIKISMKRNFQLRDNQRDIFRFLISDGNFKPLSATCGSGKSLPNTTPIKVPGGWKTISELQVGDRVAAVDGTITEVTGVYPQGVQQLYVLHFVDDRTILASKEHLWQVSTRGDNDKVIDTATLFDIFRKDKEAKYSIPLVRSEQGAEVELPVHPYVLGVILGDLHYTSGSCINDKWIISKVLNCLDHKYNYVENPNSLHHGYLQPMPTDLTTGLQQLQLCDVTADNYFLPEIYLNASHQQRLDVIRGLMDICGDATSIHQHVPQYYRQSCELYVRSEKLAKQIQQLLWSLGCVCTIFPRTQLKEHESSKTLYFLYFLTRNLRDFICNPCKLPSNVDYWQKVTHLPIISIQPVPMKAECTCISVAHDSHLYVAEKYIVTHNTVVTLAAVAELKCAAMLVLGLLIDQWYKSLRQFTNLRKDDIFVIQGFDALKNLWEMVKHGYKPKVIIFSTRTLVLYAVEKKLPYSELPSYQDLLETLGIGILIHDEVHLNFYANTQIDLRSNVKHNIFLSATYMRSDPTGKRVFNTVFPRDMIYGAEIANKYTVVYIVSYTVDIPDSCIVRFKVLKGYLHAKYESFILRNRRYAERFVDEVLRLMIDQFFITERKPDQKLLILCQTKKFVLFITEQLKKYYQKLQPVPYFSGDNVFGKAKQLEHMIIVSTIRSCSTGIDIKGLKTCINTVSFSSEPQAAQCMGRLRQLPGEETIYVDLYNRDIPSHCFHIRSRWRAYNSRALTIRETSV